MAMSRASVSHSVSVLSRFHSMNWVHVRIMTSLVGGDVDVTGGNWSREIRMRKGMVPWMRRGSGRYPSSVKSQG